MHFSKFFAAADSNWYKIILLGALKYLYWNEMLLEKKKSQSRTFNLHCKDVHTGGALGKDFKGNNNK